MAEIVKDMWAGMPWYLYLILILSIGLLIASFVVPPLGAIHPSVLQGVALILGGTWLLYTTVNIPTFIASGAKIRAEYKGAKLEIGRHKNKEGNVEDSGSEAAETEE